MTREERWALGCLAYVMENGVEVDYSTRPSFGGINQARKLTDGRVP